ncbi:hypothetical protein [Hahella ganghwensis]|uniref:hypothetical protein n=1 Tax=Hahella ganghwensis TaxID=286420 RepID=UPI00037C9184|nr:hypothetical protein [Hahella ganghwensis]
MPRRTKESDSGVSSDHKISSEWIAAGALYAGGLLTLLMTAAILRWGLGML